MHNETPHGGSICFFNYGRESDSSLFSRTRGFYEVPLPPSNPSFGSRCTNGAFRVNKHGCLRPAPAPSSVGGGFGSPGPVQTQAGKRSIHMAALPLTTQLQELSEPRLLCRAGIFPAIPSNFLRNPSPGVIPDPEGAPETASSLSWQIAPSTMTM